MLLVESVTPQSHFSLGIWDVLKRTRSRFVTQHDAVVADPWRCLLWSGSRVPGLSHDLGFCASLGSCVCNLETWTMNSSCMQFWSLAMSAPWCTNRVAVRNGTSFSCSARSAESDVRLPFGPEAPEAANLYAASNAIAMRGGVPGNAMRLRWFGRFDEETHSRWLVRTKHTDIGKYTENRWAVFIGIPLLDFKNPLFYWVV